MQTNLKPIIVSHRVVPKPIWLWSTSITRSSRAYQTMTNARRPTFIAQTIYKIINQMLLLTHFVENQFREIQAWTEILDIVCLIISCLEIFSCILIGISLMYFRIVPLTILLSEISVLALQRTGDKKFESIDATVHPYVYALINSLVRPWEMRLWFWIELISRQISWALPLMNATRPHLWIVNTSSGNGAVV